MRLALTRAKNVVVSLPDGTTLDDSHTTAAVVVADEVYGGERSAHTEADNKLMDAINAQIAAGNITVVATDSDVAGGVATADIANLAVTTAKIADLGVTTAKIANEAVTVAKMADLAQGSVITGQTSDRPAALAVGDGQFLVGDGTDVNAVAISGDVAVDNTGAAVIQAGAVDEAMLAAQVSGLNAARVAVAEFDWEDGWTTGVAFGLGVTLPDNAIITRAYVDVDETFVGDGDDSSTISLLVPTDGDLIADVAINDGSNPWDIGIHACIQDDTVANMMKLTDARELQALVTIAATDTALTAGHLTLFVEYVIGGAL